MKCAHCMAFLLFAFSAAACPVLGDGGYFPRVEQIATAADLAQTRQEAVLAFYGGLPIADDCAQAVPVGPNNRYDGIMAHATNDGSPECGLSQSSPDVWYSYTPASSGNVSVELWTYYSNTALSVHSGCPGTDSNLLACDYDTEDDLDTLSTVSLSVTAGTRYLIRIAGRAASDASFTMSLEGPEAQAGYVPGGAVPHVTYVLRTRYTGPPAELAWIMPVPATPTNVIAHGTDSLFDQLSTLTAPTFTIMEPPRPGGLGCGMVAEESYDAGLVVVEASGQAGIFEWAALTSTGGTALVSWLSDQGFGLPPGASEILDGYIQQGMHFLGVRVMDPGQIAVGAGGEIEIPPLQFTCRTSSRFYPMAISQISAASQTEVLIYVLADHRAQGANVSNGVIDPAAITYDPTSSSSTNYESLFTQKIAALGGTALITEYAHEDEAPYGWHWAGDVYRAWSDAPTEVRDLTFLTRMRTVIARENMTLDFTFQDAPTDDAVYSGFTVYRPSDTSAAGLAGGPLAALLAFGLLRSVMRRRGRTD